MRVCVIRTALNVYSWLEGIIRKDSVHSTDWAKIGIKQSILQTLTISRNQKIHADG